MDFLSGLFAVHALAWTALPLGLSLRLRAALLRPPARGPLSGMVRVVIPLKGAPPGLEQNLAAVLDQDLPSYEVVVVTEDAADPACPIVERVLARSRVPVRLIHAGRPQHRGGKVHNLLAGVDEPGPAPAYFVFLDADARPPRGFLSRLLAPLAGEARGGVTTGYRWFQGEGAGALRAAWNAIPLHFQATRAFAQAWGGATAIARETFVDARVREAWDRAVSDDAAMTRAVRELHRPVVFVPEALSIDSREEPPGVFWRWGVRQAVILKCCSVVDWVLAVASFSLILASLWWALWSLLAGGPWLALLGLGPVLGMWLQGLGLVRASALVAKRLQDPRFLLPRRAAFSFPLGYLWLFGQLVAAAPRREIDWGGRRYRLHGPFSCEILAPEAGAAARSPQPGGI